ncbi:ammonium transporter [Nocardia sp. NPDC005366]|uniref:ammonium transporter n=1 Tax=Nocardia sp. NPDC005366 TaxID=3156878 RepID=UPI0033A4E82B
MILRKITAASVPLAAAIAVGVGAGASHAQPVEAKVPDIGYHTRLVGNTVVTTLTGGTFDVTGDSVTIEDAAGRPVTTMPLSFRLGGLEFPLPHVVRDDATVLELTVIQDREHARPVAVTPVASAIENLRAQDAFETQFGIATAVGTFVGTVIGAGIGLIGFLGGGLGIGTVATGAAIGGIVGTLVVGGPALIIAGIDMINTLTAPPGASKFAQPKQR